MTRFPWQGRLAAIFLLIAVAFNVAHYAVFHDSGYIARFLLAQLGFLPVSVYLVTVVVNELLGRREKQTMLKKLNMVIGTFFSEVGTELLRVVSRCGPEEFLAREPLRVRADWNAADYDRALAVLKGREVEGRPEEVDWKALRSFLSAKRDFLLSLLANPNLLEHETFSELLWAVFHLAEELGSRRSVAALLENDAAHLAGDVARVYVLLLAEWLSYMRHLQEDYPYLFSLAVRTNPFDPEARAEIA